MLLLVKFMLLFNNIELSDFVILVLTPIIKEGPLEIIAYFEKI
jgi:hypothetical protein